MKWESKQHLPIGALIGGTMYLGLVVCQENNDDNQPNICNSTEPLLKDRFSTGTKEQLRNKLRWK